MAPVAVRFKSFAYIIHKNIIMIISAIDLYVLTGFLTDKVRRIIIC